MRGPAGSKATDFVAGLLSIFAAAPLTQLGIFRGMADAVAERTREFGVRASLAAARGLLLTYRSE